MATFCKSSVHMHFNHMHTMAESSGLNDLNVEWAYSLCTALVATKSTNKHMANLVEKHMARSSFI